MLSLKEINERNRTFWEEQNRLRNERIQDPVLVQMVLDKLNSPQFRLIPAARTSFEQLLEDAAREKGLVLTHCEPLLRQQALREQARKAGRSKRADALQRLIVALVEARRDITVAQLRDKLQAFPRPNPIQDVDEDGIWHLNGSGKLKSAPFSGLKDRLSRAKKFLNSR
jgi:hypothetical protein